MKKRVPEMQDFCDRDEAEAARLLRSLPPTTASEAAERRVHARVCAGPSRGPRLLRVAVLVTALLVSTTILSATLARRWLAGSDHASSAALTMPGAQPKHPIAQREQVPEVKPALADSLAASPSVADQAVVASVSHVATHRALATRRQAVAASDVRDSVEESPSIPP